MLGDLFDGIAAIEQHTLELSFKAFFGEGLIKFVPGGLFLQRLSLDFSAPPRKARCEILNNACEPTA